MPQTVTIDLPLVVAGRGGHSLVRPIGFSEYARTSSKTDNAVRSAQRRVVSACREYTGTHLIGRLIRGKVSPGTVRVEIAPPKRDTAWREPLKLHLDSFVWTQDESLVVTYVPVLDLTVVASPGTDVDNLVQEQVRSAIRRSNAWTLEGLAELDRYELVELLQQRIAVNLPTPAELARKSTEQPAEKTPTLKAVATKLKRKSLRQAYFREQQVEMLGQLLQGDFARSVLLVGPSGVGKTAIFHQWVRTRDRWGMKHVQCWATDGSRLISGQTGFGMWQKQCLAMADEAAKYPSVVHLGNLIELCQSGRNRGSGGCGSLLAPRLADGSLIGIIECTAEQLTRIQRTEPRVVSALTPLAIDEPTSEQTRSILLEAATSWRRVDISADLKRKRGKMTAKRKRKAKRLAEQAELVKPTVEPESLEVLDRLHRRFQTDAASPGRPLAFFHTVMSEMESGSSLDAQHVIDAFGRQTGLPGFLVDDSVRPDLEKIQTQLSNQVLGQDEVIKTLVDVVATLAADLSRTDRPLASLLLIGPTGVGKTETAKALARLIYSDVSRLVRIDMSELSGPMAVGRLIGDAVNPEGLLTAAVRAQPFSLVLLDEFEKAHPSVFDLLLQVLGEGRLTDGQGRVADFRNSIVMMTSNLGVESFKASKLGLADTQKQDRYRNHFERQVREFLRPEMFNRIDRILSYAPLEQSVVEQIATMRIDDVQKRDGWKHRGNSFDVAADVTQTLARDGYQPQYGARPLAREVEKSVVLPLSEAICDIGRNQPVDVSVQVDDAQQVLVEASARKVKDRRSADEITRLVGEMTMIRRRGQSLQRCSAVRELRNRLTTYRRVWKRWKAKQRSKAIHDSLHGRQYQELRQQLRAINKLGQDLNAAEASLLVRYHRDNEIELEATRAQIQTLKDRLWDTLCELQTQKSADNQRITLVLTGPNLSLAKPLLECYRSLAKKRDWNLQAHAILPRDDNHRKDRVIHTEGWSSEPSFRISTRRVEPSNELSPVDLDIGSFGHFEAIEQLSHRLVLAGAASEDRPRLAAYRLLRTSSLAQTPPGTLGVMVTFRGRAADLMMTGEVGVHSFRSGDQTKKSSQSILVSKHGGTPIEYAAPDWLADKSFQLTGNPRRGYDLKQREIMELSQADSRTYPMDRKGKWFEKVIKIEMERRIWSALDEE